MQLARDAMNLFDLITSIDLVICKTTLINDIMKYIIISYSDLSFSTSALAYITDNLATSSAQHFDQLAIRLVW